MNVIPLKRKKPTGQHVTLFGVALRWPDGSYVRAGELIAEGNYIYSFDETGEILTVTQVTAK
jgi:hypothetical protein